MTDVLEHLDRSYGGPLGYLDTIGFDEGWRLKLKGACGPPTLAPAGAPRAGGSRGFLSPLAASPDPFTCREPLEKFP
jgi:hypothetical protein